MGNRKQHNLEAGYVAERMNPLVPGTKVTIYVAKEQGIDVGPDKYVVVCDIHGSVVGVSSIPKSRQFMKDPAAFCIYCLEIEKKENEL